MSTLILALLTLWPACQDPQPASPPPPSSAPGDVVVLQSGEELAGTVLVDTSTYLEIRVGSDTIVGVPRSDVREVRRGVAPVPAGPAPSAPEPEVAPDTLASRDDWFVLHDGEGRCVGTVHSVLRPGEEGGLRLAREWEFVADNRRTQITEFETLRCDGTPTACFYHERTLHLGEREPRDERLVRGEYDGATLQLVRTSVRGSERTDYRVGKGLAFPLLLREQLRQHPARLGFSGTRVVYDASRDELRQVSFASGERRRVELDGQAVEVREVRIGDGARGNVTWIDGAGREVRFEVNGAALVGVASKKDVATALVASHARSFPAAVLREAQARFSLWLPNPVWRFDEEQTAGQVTAQAPLYDASVSAMVLDQLSPGAHLGMAADTVERLLRVVCRDFKVRTRETTEVRRQNGMLVQGTYARVDRGRSVRCEVTVLVLRAPDDAFLALCFAAPAAEVDVLRPDFDRMVETLELDPAQVAAEARAVVGVAPPTPK
ncbi:MAG: hypothetical protein R3F56_06155 [Planctomycetota bacterium]